MRPSRLLAAFLATALTFSLLTGCSGQPNPSSSGEESIPEGMPMEVSSEELDPDNTSSYEVPSMPNSAMTDVPDDGGPTEMPMPMDDLVSSADEALLETVKGIPSLSGLALTAGEFTAPIKTRGYKGESGDLHLSIYCFETKAAADAVRAGISADGTKVTAPSDGATASATNVSWVAAPHFFQSDRYLILYCGEDATVLGELKGAFGSQFAGA